MGQYCEKAGCCLHALALPYANAKDSRITVYNPAFVAAQPQCPYYLKNEKVRVAYGMMTMMDRMPAALQKDFIHAMKELFERRHYFSLRRGSIYITPDEQAKIRQVLERLFGPKHSYDFDRYGDAVLWK